MAGHQGATRWYSFVTESNLGSYSGFRHRFQHKSLGGLGSGAGIEMACENPRPNEANQALHNVWAITDRYHAGGNWIETFAAYICPQGGTHLRGTGWQFWQNETLIANPPLQVFTDVDVEHEYAAVHDHGIGLTCGSLPDEKAWFVLRDGIKTGCAGFHDGNASAPHFRAGDYGDEINNGTFGRIKVRHHYYSNIAYFTGTAWAVTNFDSPTVTYPPSGGHGDTVVSRNWWHACSASTSTCH